MDVSPGLHYAPAIRGRRHAIFTRTHYSGASACYTAGMAHVFSFSRNRADYDRGFHISMEATAEVFFNGDLDAAWEDLFRIGDETVARQNLPATEKSQPTEARHD